MMTSYINVYLLDFPENGRFVPIHFGGRNMNDGSFSRGPDGDRMWRMLGAEDAEGSSHKMLVE